jgi:hypothetical protein
VESNRGEVPVVAKLERPQALEHEYARPDLRASEILQDRDFAVGARRLAHARKCGRVRLVRAM